MKRIALFLSSLIFSICVFSQASATRHLKFMGIPLTGNITQFQAKLVQKGCTFDKLASRMIASGCRAFKGDFIGNKANIYVYYDTKTKIVYRAKAVLSDLSEDIVEQKYGTIKDLLLRKYADAYYNEGVRDEKEACALLPKREGAAPDVENGSWEETYGEIDIYITKDEQIVNYPYYFNLHIDYTDQINSDKREGNIMEDL